MCPNTTADLYDPVNLNDPECPLKPLSTQQILDDLAVSRRQIEEGRYRPLDEVMDELARKYGLI